MTAMVELHWPDGLVTQISQVEYYEAASTADGFKRWLDRHLAAATASVPLVLAGPCHPSREGDR